MNGMRILGYLAVAVPIPFKGHLCTKTTDKGARRCCVTVRLGHTLWRSASIAQATWRSHLLFTMVRGSSLRTSKGMNGKKIDTAHIERLAAIIAAEIGAKPAQVAAAIGLLDEGATVPFVARYRKEATGGLDDTQLRLLAERLVYLRELDARRETILDSIREQGKLTDELEAKIAAVTTKAELEDIYLPYKPKRRTKAEIARERGLGPLAEAILADRAAVPAELAAAYLTDDVPDAKAALDGARDILSEQFAENADLRRPPAQLHEGAGLPARAGRRRQAGGRREILRLFRPCRALGRRAEPPGARHAARPQRGRAVARYRGRCRRHLAGQAGRADDRAGLRASAGSFRATAG